MSYYPNALRYYETAGKQGFSNKVLPFLTARCTGAVGETGEAVEIYMSVLSDKQSPFRYFVRTDIGRMFLRRNDGEQALKWYTEAIDRRQNYAEALGGAALAHTILHHFEEGEEMFRKALLNQIGDPVGYSAYFKEIKAAALAETEHK